MRACGQLFHCPYGLKAHKTFTVFIQHSITRGHGFADAILLGADHPPHADIKGGHPTVDFRVGDEPFFDAQHIERFDPIWSAAHFCGLGSQCTEQAVAVSRRHCDFIGMFA